MKTSLYAKHRGSKDHLPLFLVKDSSFWFLVSLGKMHPYFAEQGLKYTTPRTDLYRCMKFKVVKQINHIGVVEFFTKPNCNIFLEECFKIV